MKDKPAYFVFSPGENHICHLEAVFDSIANTISIDFQFCVLLPSHTCKVKSKYPVITKVISKEHDEICKSLYFQEGRADIQPFAAYSQLFLPYYFTETDDFLFMEVDQIVKGDLAPLFRKCRIGNVSIAAVRSIDSEGNFSSPASFSRNFPGKRYFNMGVVYVNRGLWISCELTDLCIKEAKLQIQEDGKRYDFYTQGAMNSAFSDKFTELDIKYNLTGLGYKTDINKLLLDSAAILHWNGSQKPWAKNGLYRELYYSKYKLKQITLKEILENISVKFIERTTSIFRSIQNRITSANS